MHHANAKLPQNVLFITQDETGKQFEAHLTAGFFEQLDIHLIENLHH